MSPHASPYRIWSSGTLSGYHLTPRLSTRIGSGSGFGCGALG